MRFSSSLGHEQERDLIIAKEAKEANRAVVSHAQTFGGFDKIHSSEDTKIFKGCKCAAFWAACPGGRKGHSMSHASLLKHMGFFWEDLDSIRFSVYFVLLLPTAIIAYS